MQIKFVSNSSRSPARPLRKLLALIVTAVIVVLALMFSAALLAIIVIGSTIGWTYMWWKTRALRKQLREFSRQAPEPGAQASNDKVFEGEVIRVVDPKDVK